MSLFFGCNVWRPNIIYSAYERHSVEIDRSQITCPFYVFYTFCRFTIYLAFIFCVIILSESRMSRIIHRSYYGQPIEIHHIVKSSAVSLMYLLFISHDSDNTHLIVFFFTITFYLIWKVSMKLNRKAKTDKIKRWKYIKMKKKYLL